MKLHESFKPSAKSRRYVCQLPAISQRLRCNLRPIALVKRAFGADHRPRFKSGGHGSWVQTGPREIAWTTLSFDHGQEENHAELGPFNPYATTVRISALTTFGDDFTTLATKTNVAVLPANLDPLDPASEPLFPAFQGEHAGRKIPAQFGRNE